MTKIRPLADHILIEPLEKETTLPSGIVIPDTAKEKPQEGKVLAVGPGRKDEHGKVVPIEVTVGSIVMYKKWGGTEIKIDGKEHLLVKEEDVIAVVE
ncbi:MAG: co-chaperone GroES [Patescibacteria group bacterium]|jgi:chaperonin GroES